MFQRTVKTLRLPAAPLACFAFLLGPMPSWAQPEPRIAPAQFDPSDVYFQGYLARRAAEDLEAAGDFIGASEKLQSARKLFEAVDTYYPTWKSEMVDGAIAKNSETLTKLHPQAEEQRKKNRNVVAELEGGAQQSGSFIDPADGVVPLTPGILEIDPLASRRLAEAEAEVKRLRDIAETPSTDPARNESRIRDIARQRDATQAQLNAAEKNLQTLRSRLASKPVESELRSLNQRIAGLEQERQAMAMALGQSRTQHTEALSRNAILQADLTVMQQKYADLDRDLKAERNVANSVVSGQRAQIQALEKDLASKNIELGKANERINSLVDQLQESQASFAQLQTEHNTLLQERDQMSALLKLNEDGRIQDLIQQNIGLAKTLREANEKVESLQLDNDAAKDDITDALRDLAIAKEQINKLHQEKRNQDKRLAELETRLRGEESALASGKVAADPEEVAMLRDIIQRQLRVQERRRQARELLIEAVKDMGTQDERIAQAIKLFDGQEIQLSPDEQRLIADKKVDGEFISPFAQDRATVGRNTSELNRDIAIFERTAEKSFAAGRMLPTRELFEMIIEQNPGHIPALCKLGVVHLRLGDAAAAVDTFRRACELESSSPYAHRMLGVSLMKLGELSAAEESAKQAVELAPADVRNYMLLANITYSLGRDSDAESYLKAAIVADPLASDPYYNLAVLCARNNRLEEAQNHYNQALERGAVPDPKLEERLVKP